MVTSLSKQCVRSSLMCRPCPSAGQSLGCWPDKKQRCVESARGIPKSLGQLHFLFSLLSHSLSLSLSLAALRSEKLHGRAASRFDTDCISHSKGPMDSGINLNGCSRPRATGTGRERVQQGWMSSEKRCKEQIQNPMVVISNVSVSLLLDIMSFHPVCRIGPRARQFLPGASPPEATLRQLRVNGLLHEAASLVQTNDMMTPPLLAKTLS